MATERPRTLGDLKASGYRSEPVKDEMRRNLVTKIQSGVSLLDSRSGAPQAQPCGLMVWPIWFEYPSE